MRKPTSILYWFSLLLAGLLASTALLAQAQTAGVEPVSDTEQVTPVTVQVGPVDDAGRQLFVPKTRITAVGTLEFRREAVVTGPEVKLRDVCRWSLEDSASFLPIADLVIDKLESKRPKKIRVDDLRQTLQDAGVNQGLMQLTGSTCCLVSCADSETNTPADDRTALNQWIGQTTAASGAAVRPNAGSASGDSAPTTTSNFAFGKSPAGETGRTTPTSNLLRGMAPAGSIAPNTPDPATAIGSEISGSDSFHTLRDLLLSDLSQRLNLPIDQMQMTVDPKDANLMSLSEPTFHFELEPERVRDLGRVSWDVAIMTGKSTQKVTITGEARAWEQQLIVAKAVAARQVLRDDDIIERRTLIDHIDDDPVLTRAQIVGQQASRDLRPGSVMTARMVESVPLAKVGQYVSIKLTQGGVQVQTVAKAMQSGSFGETIRVKNEATNEIFAATLTGPQTAVMGIPDTK